MPMPRNKAREEAYQLWRASNGRLSSGEIAKTLAVSPSQVRNWKSKDKWEERLAAEGPPERKAKKSAKQEQASVDNGQEAPAKRKRGAPYGNHNGKGAPPGNHRGTGAPPGNKNAMKGGTFERFAYAYMEDDEAEIAGDVTQPDIERELLTTFAFLKARELRLLKRIERIRGMERGGAPVIASTSLTTSDTQRERSRGSESEHTDMQITNASSTEDMLNKLEAELDKVQRQKVKILTQLDNMRLQRERLEVERLRAQSESDQSRLANEWVEALLAVAAEEGKEEGAKCG